MQKQIVRILLLLFIPGFVFSQHTSKDWKKIDFGTTQSLPMRNAKVFCEDYIGTRLIDGMPGVRIVSKNDSVFSVCDGITTAVFDLGTSKTVVMQDENGMFYALSGFNSVEIKKGYLLKKGQFLGSYRPDSVYQYSSGLLFIILKKDADFLAEKEVWEILKKANESTCLKEAIAYQLNQ